jgi:hypothetical protein
MQEEACKENQMQREEMDNAEDSFFAGCIIRTTQIPDALCYVFYNLFLLILQSLN